MAAYWVGHDHLEEKLAPSKHRTRTVTPFALLRVHFEGDIFPRKKKTERSHMWQQTCKPRLNEDGNSTSTVLSGQGTMQ